MLTHYIIKGIIYYLCAVPFISIFVFALMQMTSEHLKESNF